MLNETYANPLYRVCVFFVRLKPVLEAEFLKRETEL